MRDAPQRDLLTTPGAARSVRPLAKSGPMPALEAIRRDHARVTAAADSARTRRPPSIPRAARRASTEFGGGRRRGRPKGGAPDGGGSPNQVYGQPYRGFESLPLR